MPCHSALQCSYFHRALYIFFFCFLLLLYSSFNMYECTAQAHMRLAYSKRRSEAANDPTPCDEELQTATSISLSLSFPMLFHANEVEWHSNSNIIRSTMISSSGKQTLNEKKPTERNRDNNNKNASRMQLQAHSKIAIFRKRLLSIILIMQ